MTMKFCALLIALPLLAVTPAAAAEWGVDTAKSRLEFSGVQNEMPFKGSFGKWTAEISFDPAHPGAGHVKVTIDRASPKTGDIQRDTALPQAEWFDVKSFPQASFEAGSVVAKGGDAYEAPGGLTIRGMEHWRMGGARCRRRCRPRRDQDRELIPLGNRTPGTVTGLSRAPRMTVARFDL